MNETALLVIDVQNEMFDEGNPVYKSERLIENLQDLIGKARAAYVPVMYVQHNDGGLVKGTNFWEIHPSISPQEGDPVIQKWTPDSFHQTSLQDELEAKGIRNLVITGNQTEMCVDTTCRRAYSLGYNVTLVSDAHGTWDSESLSAEQIIGHHNAVLGKFAAVKETKEIEFSEE